MSSCGTDGGGTEPPEPARGREGGVALAAEAEEAEAEAEAVPAPPALVPPLVRRNACGGSEVVR